MDAAQQRNHAIRPGLALPITVGLLFVFAAGAAAGAGSASGGAGQDDPWVVPPRRAAVPNPIPKSDQVVAKGDMLYQMECASCHGKTGQNDGPGAKKIAAEMKAALKLTDPKVQEQSDGALFWKTLEGRNSMPSTAKDLTDEERWMIVHFLRTLPAPSSK
jgi:mono/diheme cytochrome c family protein